MNALDMASVIEADCPFDLSEAAIVLRRQHEAIVKLREAVRIFQMGFEPDKHGYLIAKQALKDTEEIAK